MLWLCYVILTISFASAEWRPHGAEPLEGPLPITFIFIWWWRNNSSSWSAAETFTYQLPLHIHTRAGWSGPLLTLRIMSPASTLSTQIKYGVVDYAAGTKCLRMFWYVPMHFFVTVIYLNSCSSAKEKAINLRATLQSWQAEVINS